MKRGNIWLLVIGLLFIVIILLLLVGKLGINGFSVYDGKFENLAMQKGETGSSVLSWFENLFGGDGQEERKVNFLASPSIAESKTIKAYSGVAQALSFYVSDADNDILTVTIPSQTQQGGKLTLTSNNSVNGSGYVSLTYSTVNFVGTDSFTYNVFDGANSVQGTITFDVHDVSEATWLPPI